MKKPADTRTMNFFDCNCSYGVPSHPAFRFARTPAELLEEMDWCGIDRGLVYVAGLRYGSPVLWNELTAPDLASQPRLEPTWGILPSQTGEQSPPEQFVTQMKASGVRALWAFPNEHHYRLDGVTFGDLLELLTEKHIPLFVKLNAIALGELMKDFPDLTAVAVNQGPHSLERYLRPLFDTYPNLYLDTSYLLVEGLIEEFCERYGPRRLLFGSAFPDNCSGSALLRLTQAEIDDEAKRAIAGDNLERLLEEVRI